MGLPERIFYTVEEVAERWNKAVDDLWQLAAAGELFLSIWYKGYCFKEDFEMINESYTYGDFQSERNDGFSDATVNLRFEATILEGLIDITKETAIEFITLPPKENVKTYYLMVNNKPRVFALKTNTEGLRCSLQTCFVPTTVKIEKKMVVVAFKEVNRLEEKYPDLSKVIVHPQQDAATTEDSLIVGKRKICRALGLSDKSFYAVQLRVKKAGLEFGRIIPGDKTSSPTLKTSEIIKLQSLSKKSTPKSKKNI